MKSLIALVIIVLGFTICVKSQSYQGTPPQKPIKPTLSMPVFKDSLKLRRDIKNLKASINNKTLQENYKNAETTMKKYDLINKYVNKI